MVRTSRIVATAGALVASAVLVAIHVDWDWAAEGTPVYVAVLAAGALLAVSVAVVVGLHPGVGLGRPGRFAPASGSRPVPPSGHSPRGADGCLSDPPPSI